MPTCWRCRATRKTRGAAFAFHTPFLYPRQGGRGGIEVEAGGGSPTKLQCDILINAAGLNAPAVARAIEGMPAG